MKNTSKPKIMLLKDCITDPCLIERYLSENINLKNKDLADYVLVASNTHLLYKYETDENVWYVHYGPYNVFKICVYRLATK